MEDMNRQILLEQVEQAIFNIAAGGQSYRIGSHQVTRADLNMLYKIKNDLESQLSGGTQGLLDNCFTAVFDRR